MPEKNYINGEDGISQAYQGDTSPVNTTPQQVDRINVQAGSILEGVAKKVIFGIGEGIGRAIDNIGNEIKSIIFGESYVPARQAVVAGRSYGSRRDAIEIDEEVNDLSFGSYVSSLAKTLQGNGLRVKVVPHSAISRLLGTDLALGAAKTDEFSRSEVFVPEELPKGKKVVQTLYKIGRNFLGYGFEQAVRDYGIAHEASAVTYGEETPKKHALVEHSALQGLRYLSQHGSDTEIRKRAEKAYYAGLIVDYIGSKVGDGLSSAVASFYSPIREIGRIVDAFTYQPQPQLVRVPVEEGVR